MLKQTTPARRQPGQGLDNDSHKINSSKKHPQLPIGKNREKILDEIAIKWSSKGLFPSPSRAMIALLGGVI